MNHFFSPGTASADTPASGSSIDAASSAAASSDSQSSVSEGLRDLTEDEIDAHIKSLGDLADRAYKAGDKDAARSWMTAMYAAIAARTPARGASLSASTSAAGEEQPIAVVGRFRLSHIALRRVKYALRFIYWTCKHRPTKHVAWVLAFEGYTWN